jgi:hypothetical protein
VDPRPEKENPYPANRFKTHDPLLDWDTASIISPIQEFWIKKKKEKKISHFP